MAIQSYYFENWSEPFTWSNSWLDYVSIQNWGSPEEVKATRETIKKHKECRAGGISSIQYQKLHEESKEYCFSVIGEYPDGECFIY